MKKIILTLGLALIGASGCMAGAQPHRPVTFAAAHPWFSGAVVGGFGLSGVHLGRQLVRVSLLPMHPMLMPGSTQPLNSFLARRFFALSSASFAACAVCWYKFTRPLYFRSAMPQHPAKQVQPVVAEMTSSPRFPLRK